jgi:hypothetical protein
MSNKMLLNVLSLKKWKMTDETSGEVREGCTVFVGQETEDPSGNTLGWDVVKFSAPLFVFDRAKVAKLVFPSECSVQIALKMGAAGKAAMQVLDIDVGA